MDFDLVWLIGLYQKNNFVKIMDMQARGFLRSLNLLGLYLDFCGVALTRKDLNMVDLSITPRFQE